MSEIAKKGLLEKVAVFCFWVLSFAVLGIIAWVVVGFLITGKAGNIVGSLLLLEAYFIGPIVSPLLVIAAFLAYRTRKEIKFLAVGIVASALFLIAVIEFIAAPRIVMP